MAIAELAGEMEEGMLALVVGTGLKVIDVLFEEEVTALAGPKGRHDPDRTAVRHGSDDGLVTLGARQLSIRRPRLRSADGSTEVPLATYEWATDTELLERETMARMLAKLSTRRYGVGLEPMGEGRRQKSRSTSKSAVSRRFVATTESALAELMSADLSGLDLVAIMVDGANFGDHLVRLCPRDRHRRHQAPAGRGGRRHRERHGGEAPLRRPARPAAGRDPPDPVRPRRLHGAAAGDQGRLRPPGHRPV